MNFKLGITLAVSLAVAVLSGCQNAPQPTAATNAGNSNVVIAPPVANVTTTPTEAFKGLFAAVKSQNTAAIKQYMSKTTQEFAEGAAAMQKKTSDEMFKNGFIASTMSPNLPPMRDERVKDNFGALEVQSPDGTWQDVPFVKEDGGWKIAVGDIFKGIYQSPGNPVAQANANTGAPQMMPVPGNANSMVNPKMNSANANSKAILKPGFPHQSGNK